MVQNLGAFSETFGLAVSQLEESRDQAKEARRLRRDVESFEDALAKVEDLCSTVSSLVSLLEDGLEGVDWLLGELVSVESGLRGVLRQVEESGDFKEELNDVLGVLEETARSFAALEGFLSGQRTRAADQT
jgi:hypothetical protein